MANRVSTAQIYENAHKHVEQARQRHVRSSEMASTQKAITRASQDPAGWMQAAGLKDQNTVRETLERNALSANQALSATETVFAQVEESLMRAYELAISQAGTGNGAGIRGSVANEVRELFQGVVQTLNYRFGNRTLLGGHETRGPAFDAEGNFLGDAGVIEVEVAQGEKVPVNVNGRRAVYGEGITGGVNLLQVLKTLETGLANDETEMIRSTLEPLQAAIDQVSQIRSEIGSRMKGLEATMARHSAAHVDAVTAISEIEDADTIKVFSDLARDHTVLNAAIRSSQKILNEQPGDLLFR